MGNWRTVNIIGTCAASEVPALKDYLSYSYSLHDSMDDFCCLSFNPDKPGLGGLGEWPAENINRCGNLAERDYDPHDVAEALKILVKLAPSLNVRVHCGGDWEELNCVATVYAAAGRVRVDVPEVESVSAPSEAQIMSNLLKNFLR